MKKLAALASMAVLLCWASASFAKKAMNAEEMDLITAAGEPSVVTVTVKQNGIGSIESTTQSSNSLTESANAQATNPGGGNVIGTVNQGTAGSGAGAFEGEAVLGEGSGFAYLHNSVFAATPNSFVGASNSAGIGISLEDVGLVLDASLAAQLGSSQSVTGPAVATLSENSSASSSSTITAGSMTVSVSPVETSTFTLNVAPNSQTNLRALTVNNVVGENQLANGFNIASSVAQAAGSQSNTVNQSWGSTYDWTYAPGAVTAVAAAAPGGSGGSIDGDHGKVNVKPCVFGPCEVAGAGGAAAATSAAIAIPNLPLTISADKITKVDVSSQGNATVDVSGVITDTFTNVLASDSQTNLAALVVNNVVGRNQVASGINVTSAGAVVVGNKSNTPLVVFDVIATGAAASFSTQQSNTINQFRGTPISQP